MPTNDSDDFREVDPRSIWPNEARDFTPWLAANITRLTKVLTFDLESIQIETEVNGGYVDITATVVGSNSRVIIENQLEETDDYHLARILTYATKHDARIIIWVAKDFCERHRQTINWMNSNTSADIEFYGVRVRAFKKGGSDPDPFFDLVVQPTVTSTGTSKPNPNIAPEDDRYRSFFQTIVDELSRRDVFKYETVRSKKSWFEFNTSLDGITYVAAFTTRFTARAKLHIRCRVESNHRIYEYLVERKQEFEDMLGEPLKWEERGHDNRHRHLIGLYNRGSIDMSEDELSELLLWMIEKLRKLKRVFDPYLDNVAT